MRSFFCPIVYLRKKKIRKDIGGAWCEVVTFVSFLFLHDKQGNVLVCRAIGQPRVFAALIVIICGKRTRQHLNCQIFVILELVNGTEQMQFIQML